ncbi:MAG: hypothetical protein OEY70_06820 [Acidimicrobiia bacterium]|nr:hypothetical protein [Acidimicrobiia bacterium]
MKVWPTPGAFPILAHQGGWDEMLMVVGPLALVGGALWLANRRVTRQLAEQGHEQAKAGAGERVAAEAEPDTAP